MEKERDTMMTLFNEHIELARKRTLYTKELAFFSVVRTVILLMAIIVFIGEMIVKSELYLLMVFLFFALLGLVIFVESLYKFHLHKEKGKNLEERVD